MNFQLPVPLTGRKFLLVIGFRIFVVWIRQLAVPKSFGRQIIRQLLGILERIVPLLCISDQHFCMERGALDWELRNCVC
jgi:hypothetical protein